MHKTALRSLYLFLLLSLGKTCSGMSIDNKEAKTCTEHAPAHALVKSMVLEDERAIIDRYLKNLITKLSAHPQDETGELVYDALHKEIMLCMADYFFPLDAQTGFFEKHTRFLKLAEFLTEHRSLYPNPNQALDNLIEWIENYHMTDHRR